MVIVGESVRNIIINTGNLLSLNDITKKPGQNPTEELCEAIKITFNDGNNYTEQVQQLVISPRHNDLIEKMSTQERTDLKIGVKLFLNSDSERTINEAVGNVFTALEVESIDNLIVSYNYKVTNPNIDDRVAHLKNVWKALEKFTENRKVLQIGISDVDEPTFRALYENANIKPSIIQINLATCCVVPPSLQAFCKENEVQLLTHSDPSEILPKESVTHIFNDETINVHWVSRFLIHIKCRGVLTTKGYLINLYRY